MHGRDGDASGQTTGANTASVSPAISAESSFRVDPFSQSTTRSRRATLTAMDHSMRRPSMLLPDILLGSSGSHGNAGSKSSGNDGTDYDAPFPPPQEREQHLGSSFRSIFSRRVSESAARSPHSPMSPNNSSSSGMFNSSTGASFLAHAQAALNAGLSPRHLHALPSHWERSNEQFNSPQQLANGRSTGSITQMTSGFNSRVASQASMLNAQESSSSNSRRPSSGAIKLGKTESGTGSHADSLPGSIGDSNAGSRNGSRIGVASRLRRRP
ncbi:hypothetical protein BC831DRAFT_277083 [Entophlyctis helioformis]|nr:hypothetical protein BC831DRAFT_277083 [Entophlyctis helioformis]